jgi:clathrin coat assembly protein AP180
MQQPMHDPFYASSSIATARGVQMATMAQQQQAFMLQQQQMMMMAGQQVHHQHSYNPFVDPYMYAGVHTHGAGMQLHAGNTGTRML